ncbi:Triacylglycerol lipase 2 [Platanthera zijinensis]|uniref:Triacylglycerol lipase 2 n=1 Tax=Platanthera zijinensis TaxID=2320716 RepID=A0AAP0B2X9_9ASPA
MYNPGSREWSTGVEPAGSDQLGPSMPSPSSAIVEPSSTMAERSPACRDRARLECERSEGRRDDEEDGEEEGMGPQMMADGDGNRDDKLIHVTTKDGYILSLQRLPAGGRRGSSSGGNKGPVLLQHGLFVDGFTWLVNSPSESLGYILADNGYDVWIANSRGTIYSLGHTSLSSDDPAYWDWSWDELAAYDLPAVVGYAYQQSGHRKLHYVGHSLGTLIALASFSEQKLINMIRSAALLSPIAYVNHIPSLFLQGAARIYLLEELYWLGIARLNPSGTEVKKLVERICKDTGFDCYDLLTVFTAMRRGVISKYDYDNLVKNLAHYGRPTPPVYDMASIPNDFPVFLGYGKDDVLSDVGDVTQLLGVLHGHDGNDLTVHLVESYAHADFIMAVNANKLVYDPLMDFFSFH